MKTPEGKCLNFGVPQGSVLGPRKYYLFSKPIGAICSWQTLLYHCYADDTQVYMATMLKSTWPKSTYSTISATRSLRSESGAFFAVPATRGVTYGNKRFRKAAATLWNNLSVTIRKCKTLDTFKKKIKTNLLFQLFLAEYIMYLAEKNYVFLNM